MHRNNICHRDLKPDNILVNVNNEEGVLYTKEDANRRTSDPKFLPVKVKIVDLNVAYEVDPKEKKIYGGTGHREWSAPETYRSCDSNTMNIDSWTLGCIMYNLITGE